MHIFQIKKLQQKMIDNYYLHKRTSKVFIILLISVAFSQCSFDLIDFMSVQEDFLDDFYQCGYHTYPIITLTNGTVNLWKYNSYNFSTLQKVSCFRFGDRIEDEKRYIGFLPDNIDQSNPYILSKNHQTYLQPISSWRPEVADGQIITDIKFSRNIIVVFVTGIKENYLTIYRIQDLSLIRRINYDAGRAFYLQVDNYDSIILFRRQDRVVQIIYGYSTNYQSVKRVYMPVISGHFFSMQNVGKYTLSRTIQSRLLFYYREESVQKIATKLYLNIWYQEKDQGNIQVETQTQDKFKQFQFIQANFSEPKNHSLVEFHIHCGSQKLIYNTQTLCLSYNGQCITNKQLINANCIQTYDEVFTTIPKIKVTVAYIQGTQHSGEGQHTQTNNPMIRLQIYEQQNTKHKVLTILVISGVALVVFGIIIAVVLNKMGVSCCRKKIHENLLKDNYYTYVQ